MYNIPIGFCDFENVDVEVNLNIAWNGDYTFSLML